MPYLFMKEDEIRLISINQTFKQTMIFNCVSHFSPHDRAFCVKSVALHLDSHEKTIQTILRCAVIVISNGRTSMKMKTTLIFKRMPSIIE